MSSCTTLPAHRTFRPLLAYSIQHHQRSAHAAGELRRPSVCSSQCGSLADAPRPLQPFTLGVSLQQQQSSAASASPRRRHNVRSDRCRSTTRPRAFLPQQQQPAQAAAPGAAHRPEPFRLSFSGTTMGELQDAIDGCPKGPVTIDLGGRTVLLYGSYDSSPSSTTHIAGGGSRGNVFLALRHPHPGCGLELARGRLVLYNRAFVMVNGPGVALTDVVLEDGSGTGAAREAEGAVGFNSQALLSVQGAGSSASLEGCAVITEVSGGVYRRDLVHVGDNTSLYGFNCLLDGGQKALVAGACSQLSLNCCRLVGYSYTGLAALGCSRLRLVGCKLAGVRNAVMGLQVVRQADVECVGCVIEGHATNVYFTASGSLHMKGCVVGAAAGRFGITVSPPITTAAEDKGAPELRLEGCELASSVQVQQGRVELTGCLWGPLRDAGGGGGGLAGAAGPAAVVRVVGCRAQGPIYWETSEPANVSISADSRYVRVRAPAAAPSR